MPSIQASDLTFVKSNVRNDASNNGGRFMSDMSLVDSAYFPDVSGAERTQSKIRYRKMFFKNGHKDAVTEATENTLGNAKVYIKRLSAGEDHFMVGVGPTPASDTQTNLGSVIWSGCGIVDADCGPAVNGGTQLSLRTEINEGFHPTRLAVISNHDGSQREFIWIKSDWVPTWDQEDALPTPGGESLLFPSYTVTITLEAPGLAASYDGPTALTMSAGSTQSILLVPTGTYVDDDPDLLGHNIRIEGGENRGQIRRVSDVVGNNGSGFTEIHLNYNLSDPVATNDAFEVINTYFSEVVELGNIVGSYDVTSVTSLNSCQFYAEGNYIDNLLVYPDGTEDVTWTIEVLNNSNANPQQAQVSGVRPTGETIGPLTPFTIPNISVPSPGNYSPTHDGTKKYFTIKPACFGTAGSQDWSDGDTIVFTTTSSLSGFWVRESVRAGIRPHSGNRWEIGASGDTV